MDNYQLNIILKGLHISSKLQKKLSKIEDELRKVILVDGSIAQDRSQMYERTNQLQDLKIIVHSDDYIVITSYRMDLRNLRLIEKILRYPCDSIHIDENKLVFNFHMRNRNENTKRTVECAGVLK